ncbi:hypothetical protein ACLOJK_026336 [Asimina triloba]
MVPDLEMFFFCSIKWQKPRITEIQVRMDCNGCVQKIKKALHGINGIYDFYIDFPQQKLTIVGWADPEKIIKAIKKTRKIATVCVHTEVSEPQQQDPPPPPADQGGQPPQDATTQPPNEAAAAAAAAEQPPQQDPPKEQPPAENPSPPPPPPEPTTPPPPAATAESHPAGPSEPKDVEPVHIIHHPQDYGYGYGYGSGSGSGSGSPWNTYQQVQVGHVYRHEPPPTQYVSHSYNNYRPSPYVSASYVAADHCYVQSPPRNIRYYGRMDQYAEEYPSRTNGDGSNITSMFSDENPNACRIA